jgi:polyhydroxyalkanoate synthesis regulator phasin
MSKKTAKKTDDETVDENAEVMAAMQANNAQLQQTAQQAISQLQQYMALCAHYEQTINVLSGRVQELNRTIATLQQQS